MGRRFEAVIFDFGGVIASSPFEAFRRIEEARALPSDFIRSVNAANPDGNAWARFERGEIDRAGFEALFADESAALGHRLDGGEVLAVIAGEVRGAMVAALDRLRAEGYRIACITNNMKGQRGPGMATSDEAMRRYDAVFARFEHVLESAVAGVRKPDPRIFAMMCDLLGVAPQSCVFLDDIGVNCKGAASIGMTAIKVTGEMQALADLGALLDLSLDAASG